MTEDNDEKAKERGDRASEEKPEGPDRVLRFADEMETREEREEERQELETWVTCRLDEEIFALTVDQVQEILRVGELTRVPHAPFPVRGVTNMRGQVLPVVDLRRRLGLPEIELGEDHRIMVVDSRNRLIGLLVDRVEEVTEIDRLKIEDPPEDVMTEQSYYLVGVIHRGKDLIILLDADRVLEVRDGDEPQGDEGEERSQEDQA